MYSITYNVYSLYRESIMYNVYSLDGFIIFKEPQEARWTLLFAKAGLYSEVSCDSFCFCLFVCSPKAW